MPSSLIWTFRVASMALACGGLWAWVRLPASVCLHLMEPWMFAGLVVVGSSLWLERRWTGVAAVSTLMVFGSMILRLPVVHESPVVDRPRHLRELKGCSLLAREPSGPVRIAVWTLESDRAASDGLAAILSSTPDIIILKGTDRPQVAMHLQKALSGEVKTMSTDGGGMIAVTRGNFQYCGGEEDEWRFDLPAPAGGSEFGVVGFPYVKEVGVVPLMIGQVEGPTGILDALDWSDRVHRGAAKMGVAADFLGGANLVLIADFFAPPSAPLVSNILGGAGLRWAPTAANWPLRAGSIPGMGQHPIDQVWVGANWNVQSTRVLQGTGHQRGPIVVDLIARTSPSAQDQ